MCKNIYIWIHVNIINLKYITRESLLSNHNKKYCLHWWFYILVLMELLQRIFKKMSISRYKAAPLDCTIATHLGVVVKAFNTMSQWSVSVGQWRENGGVKWQDVDRRWQMPIPCRDLETLILWGNYLKHVKLEILRG